MHCQSRTQTAYQFKLTFEAQTKIYTRRVNWIDTCTVAFHNFVNKIANCDNKQQYF